VTRRKTPDLETAQGRRKIPAERNGFSVAIAPGARLNYRRSAKGPWGTWSVKLADGKGSSSMQRLALADDSEPADGVHVMTFKQAREAALAIARAERQAS
jgi:hypothetical protein